MELTQLSDLRYIKGVGEKRMKLYHKLGLFTVGDLLYHLPRSYLDFRTIYEIDEAPLGVVVPVRGIVSYKSGEQRIRKGFSIFKVTIVSAAQSMQLTFFNNKFSVSALQIGQEYIFYGRTGGSFLKKEMPSPAIYSIGNVGKLIPVYPQTAGLTSRMISNNILSALENTSICADPLPSELRETHHLTSLSDALHAVHFPSTYEEMKTARDRLIFEELLCFALGLLQMKSGRAEVTVTPMKRMDIHSFWNAVPFSPTNDQLAAIEDAIKDMCSGTPMNRLIQGDVGSGKTLVAAACCYFAHCNGYSSALMAPTEILAEQHYHSLLTLFEPLGLRLALLTGSCTAKQKREIKEQLANGEIDLCIGTHALLTADTNWRSLGLVITDEQHRFGVSQRMTLSAKGEQVHTLVMSATPIPRTMGLILYGDMELSVIKQLPKGRQPIDTFYIGGDKRERAYGYIRKHLSKGLQGYIVCPLVEETEEIEGSGKQAATQLFENLQNTAFSGYRLGLLHGKMKPKEKDCVMRAFANGDLQLLVATTVIEVGIDVPNAAIILIENAECFGLSQLHQLRGRVGRGTEKSTCILLSDSKSEDTKNRLQQLCKTNDGFAIAEFDLATRGPGDFFGMRQHGLPQLKIADLSQDMEVLEAARTAAAEILEQDPTLSQLPQIKTRVQNMMQITTVL